MELKGTRIGLTEMTSADTGELLNIFSHPQFFYAAALQDNISLEDAASRYTGWAMDSLSEAERNNYFMSIRRLSDLQFLGAVVLVDLFAHPNYGSQIEIGYFINPIFQHQGYAMEAAIMMKKFALEQLKVNSIYTTVDPDNLFSRKILENLGLTIAGFDELSSYKNRDGSPASRYHYRAVFS